MATKGFNPFLSETDYAAPASEAAAMSNPFLSDFSAPPPPQPAPVVNDNPFMNPFGAPPPSQPTQNAANAFLYSDNANSIGGGGGGGGNPFASFVDASSAPAAANGPFSSAGGGPMDSTNLWGSSSAAAPAPIVPTSDQIFMMDTGPDENISLFDSGGDSDNNLISGPAPPPPHSVPPSTKELLDSVTGALEATSESLMDRLRLNQPSPVNLAPSPSPSPRSPSPDLLGDDQQSAPPPPPPSANPLQPSPHQMDNILDLFDSPIQPQIAPGPKSTFDILGLYNSNSTQQQQQQQQPPAAAPVQQQQQMPPMVEAVEAAVGSLVDMTTTSNELPPSSLASIIDIQPQATNISDQQISSPPPPQQQQQPQKIFSPVTSPPQPVPPSFSATPAEIVQTIKSPEQQQYPEPPVAAEVVIPPAVPEPPVIPPAPIQHASPARAAPPERPKPPPVRSPVHEAPKQFLPSRPPPPVPPAPRITPTPSPQHQPHQPPPPPTQPPQSLPLKTTAAAAESGHGHGHPPPPIPPAPVKSPIKSPVSVSESAAPVDPISIFSAAVAPSAHPHPPPPPPAHPHVHQPSQPPPPPSSSPFHSKQSPTVSIPSVAVSSSDFPPQPQTAAAAASAFGATDDYYNKTTTAPPPAATFDDFDAKFNSISGTETDGAFTSGGGGGGGTTTASNAFGDPFGGTTISVAGADDSAWGSSSGGGSGGGFGDSSQGFGGDGFDSFLQMTEPPPVPQSTPAKVKREDGQDDEGDHDLAIFIKPRTEGDLNFGPPTALAPPPKSPAISTNSAYSEDSSNTAFVPFLSSARDTTYEEAKQTTQLNRTDSQETPQTPLFEEDTSQPLEDFPRVKCEVEGWDMHMRHPNKKKITGQRFWKKVYVTLVVQNEVPSVHIFNAKGDKDPFQEIPLQPCYSVSDIGAQQFDQFGKIFTMKIQYIFYKERPGVRPGQISKAGRMADKLSQFAAFAIQGDYQGVKEFGSDLKKLGLPLEHAPQISQLVKLGTQSFEEMKQFSAAVEESLFKLNVHRDRALQYKTEEIQVTLVDENYAEQDVYGVVTKQIARVRLFFLSFLSGVAEVEMGLNDLRRQGKEVVGRHDIIPIATEEWIRTEEIEFSNCVQLDEFEATKTIKFKPPDACYIELLRFRVRPPRHRELPLQVKTVFTTTGCRVEIRSDILVPGFTSRKLGQIPCEDVMVRFPIPECWIYMFRVEKHFRYGSVKSAHRRSGKVKGIERFLGAVEAVEQSLMEVTSGQAKYEHQHKSIVWRIARLPKEGQGAYTTHSFFCHITLQAHEQLPDNLSKYCYVEFTMPHTTVSHTVCRSIAVPSCDEPPEKCVRYLSRHEYVVEIEHTQGFQPATYNLAASINKEKEKEVEAAAAAAAAPPADPTDSWFPTEKPKDADDSDFSD